MIKEELLKSISALLDSDGLSSTAIAESLNVDKATVDSYLYKNLGTTFFQDNHYRWYLRSDYQPQKNKKVSTTSDLSKLCRYYLECIDQTDDSGYSCFANSKYGTPDYVDVSSLPEGNEVAQFAGGVNELKSKMRREKSRTEMYFGYPVRLKKIHSKKSSWVGFVVEPILVYSIDSESGELTLIDEPPVLNSSIIKGETNFSSDNDYIEELVQLEDELGLNGGIVPNMEDIAQRLKAIRPNWGWIDNIEPHELNANIQIAMIEKEGIYNKGMYFITQRSPFTKGLETELSQLATTSVQEVSTTALGRFMNDTGLDSTSRDKSPPIIEPIPMNLEQITAVSQSLSNNLTVVTGPPGTGKSQLITNLIINAIWQDKTILFASKNNKAVDIVDIRVNSISKRDVLIRTGSSKYQHRLSDFLIALLNSKPTELDHEEFSYYQEKYQHISSEETDIDNKISNFVELRNKTDLADIKFQKIKIGKSKSYLDKVLGVDVNKINNKLISLKNSCRKFDPEQQSIFDKILQLFLKKTRYKELEKQTKTAGLTLKEYGYARSDDEHDFNTAKEYIQKLESICSDHAATLTYTKLLEKLLKTDSLEELSKKKQTVHEELIKISSKLWDLSVKLMPDKLSAENRNMINRYKSLLEMINKSSVDVYNDLGKDAYYQYKRLTESATKFLPAWAVTSLSAKGKIPFEAGMFDLVIFDEASQCDIASALPLLFRAKSAVVIGDPKQLKHITSLGMNKDKRLLGKNDLFLSHPNWAYSFNSLFDLASGVVGPEGLVSLRDHHRSHKEIIQFSNDYYYEGSLRVATRYDKLVSVDGKNGVDWIDVKGKCNRPSNGSAINKIEAKKVVDTIKDILLKKKYKGTIGVVTPFRAQANYIEELVNEDSNLSEKLLTSDFKIDTAHKFQGDERDLILFSPVIANGASSGSVGFMRNDSSLFNVAITRARARLIVVGDRAYSSKGEVPYLQKFAVYTKNLETGRGIKESKALIDSGPHYPKVSPDTTVSEWEIILYEALYKAGIRAIPQYSIDAYVLDLAIIDGEHRLDVEVDGEMYHRNWTGELCRRDQLRNQRMFELGWDVKRFWVYEVRDNIDQCVKEIKTWVQKKK